MTGDQGRKAFTYENFALLEAEVEKLTKERDDLHEARADDHAEVEKLRVFSTAYEELCGFCDESTPTPKDAIKSLQGEVERLRAALSDARDELAKRGVRFALLDAICDSSNQRHLAKR